MMAVPFASRRAEGIFCGLGGDIPGYTILNLASNRLITRRFDDVVFREPSEIWDHAETVRDCEAQLEITAFGVSCIICSLLAAILSIVGGKYKPLTNDLSLSI